MSKKLILGSDGSIQNVDGEAASCFHPPKAPLSLPSSVVKCLMRLIHVVLFVLTLLGLALTIPLLPDYTGYIKSLSGASPLLSILTTRQDSFVYIGQTSSFTFYVHPGPRYAGGLIARSLFHLGVEARRHHPDQPVVSEYEFKYHSLPSLYISMARGQLCYGDVVEMSDILTDLIRRLNGGKLPSYGGRGYKFYGGIYRLGSTDFLPAGYFRFD